MKDYKRLTERDEFGNADIIGLDTNELASSLDFDGLNKLTSALNKFADLEYKIESGELVDINELMAAKTTGELTDKEIEFFIKHNEKVRKETAREILEPLREVVMKHSDCCVNLSEDIEFLWRKYGLELEDEE